MEAWLDRKWIYTFEQKAAELVEKGATVAPGAALHPLIIESYLSQAESLRNDLARDEQLEWGEAEHRMVWEGSPVLLRTVA